VCPSCLIVQAKPQAYPITLIFISVALYVRKQSAVTFKVFIVWLSNQHYYTCDVIGIKMMHRDLPYYEGMRVKNAMKINFSMNPLHAIKKWSLTSFCLHQMKAG